MGVAEEVLKHLQRYLGGDMTIIGVNNGHSAAKYSGLVGFDIRRSEFDLAAIGVQFGPGSSDNPVVRREVPPAQLYRLLKAAPVVLA